MTASLSYIDMHEYSYRDTCLKSKPKSTQIFDRATRASKKTKTSIKDKSSCYILVWTRLARVVNKFDCIAKRLNVFGGIIWNFDTKLFFKGHDQFNGIKAVGAKVINK